MLSRKHLFICATPLQLMTSINIKVSLLNDDNVTLYILDHSHAYEELYKKATRAKLFTKVILLKTKKFNKHWLQKYKISRYLIKAIEYLNYESIATMIADDTTMYDKFWVSFMDRSSWLIFLSYKKRNKNLKLNFFEDGVGSYQLLTVPQNSLDKKFSNIIIIVFINTSLLYLYIGDRT